MPLFISHTQLPVEETTQWLFVKSKHLILKGKRKDGGRDICTAACLTSSIMTSEAMRKIMTTHHLQAICSMFSSESHAGTAAEIISVEYTKHCVEKNSLSYKIDMT